MTYVLPFWQYVAEIANEKLRKNVLLLVNTKQAHVYLDHFTIM